MDLSSILGADSSQSVQETHEGTETATDTPVPEQNGGFLSSIWVWVIYGAIIVGMYFILFRPQRKREKKIKEMQASIKTGDNIVTSGGLFGKVADVGEDCFIVEFGTNRGVRIPIQKSDVIGIKSPTITPVSVPAPVKEETK